MDEKKKRTKKIPWVFVVPLVIGLVGFVASIVWFGFLVKDMSVSQSQLQTLDATATALAPTATETPLFASALLAQLEAVDPSTLPTSPASDPSGMEADCSRLRTSLARDTIRTDEAGFHAGLLVGQACRPPEQIGIDLLDSFSITQNNYLKARIVASIFSCEVATENMNAAQADTGYWDISGVQRQSVEIALGVFRALRLTNGCPQ